MTSIIHCAPNLKTRQSFRNANTPRPIPPHTATWLTLSPRLCFLLIRMGLFSFVLSACGPGLYWAKPDAAKGEFEQDLRICREMLINEVQYSETSLNPLSRGITDDALAKCLNSKGWFLAEKP